MSDLSSQESAGSTSDSPELGFDTPSSVSQILGDEASLPSIGLEYRSTRTSETWNAEEALALNPWDVQDRRIFPSTGITGALNAQRGGGWRGTKLVSISSAEASPARTYPLPDAAQGSRESAPASSTSSHESQSLFDPDSFSSRTFQVFSLQTAVGTSEQSLERWPTSGTAWRGGFSTAVTSECRSDEGGCLSSEPTLAEILEEPQNVPAKYSLSARAASGILRRAEKRGRTFPLHLEVALRKLTNS